MPSNTKISLNPGALEAAVLKLINSVNEQGQLPALLEIYIESNEIEKSRFTPEVKAAMIDYLLDRGVQIDDIDKLKKGGYDEHFALAYDYALSTAGGEDDPLDAARRKGGGRGFGQWDFTVDHFDDVEEQGVVKENILAAGALDYIFEFGERLGVFRLVDALVLNWAAGSIDVVEGPAAARLYRYWKLREERASLDERGMVFRRVLNKGSTEVLSRMVVNEPFPLLWRNLMAEVAEYIDKTEKVDDGAGEFSPVSRSRIYQATRELQYNLTEYCTGMAHVQAREFYAQLQECFEILKDDEIMSYFGGNRRKSLWTVIERLSKEEFGASPNIAAHRSLAVDGNRIFQWIANFNEAAVRQEDFIAFLQAAESYILNFTSASDQEIDEFAEEDDFEFADEDDDF
ncbi:hypothetical protein EUZ85_15525 [Hahella sp. KA22]|uniref:hypothetical protein n=1 Tax=Hahella sp. KA22 TaxID=1628392 RepID=UPI000FDE8224|nr:hypothetical protein [Hahella sp. KA22]AZZ92058.1 hypothetical protein ENC22_12960 [Hahella sp. KA22]QAY55429.1 hypothetical protein EUZ85_15525 [Hahella sp. KA22]